MKQLAPLIILVLSLVFEAESYTPAFTCYLPNLAGKQPKELCQLRDFIKALMGKKKRSNKKNDSTAQDDKVVPLGNVILILGPTGTGKTKAAHALTSNSGAICHYYHAAHIIKSQPEDAIAFVSKIYENANREAKRRGKPVILILDDLSLLDESNLNLSFLCQLRAFRTAWKKYASNPNIITIITTSRKPDKATEKLVTIVNMNLPDAQQRYDIIAHHANKINYRMPEAAKLKLARQTKGFSHLDFLHIFYQAQALARCDDREQVCDKDINEAYQDQRKNKL